MYHTKRQYSEFVIDVVENFWLLLLPLLSSLIAVSDINEFKGIDIDDYLLVVWDMAHCVYKCSPH